MNDLKQWLKRVGIIAGVIIGIQIVAMVLLFAGSKLSGDNCAGGGFSCPKERGITLQDVPYTDSLKDIGEYYGWDYMIFGCGWSRMLNNAMGCRFEELQSNSIFSPEDYNFISFGSRIQSGRLIKNVPLIRCSYGETYGEMVFPFAGYTCEYGSIGCAGCYDCGLQSCTDD